LKFVAKEPQESDYPFDIIPREFVIPGRQQASFTITFTSNHPSHHKAVILAYPRIESESDSKLGELGLLV